MDSLLRLPRMASALIYLHLILIVLILVAALWFVSKVQAKPFIKIVLIAIIVDCLLIIALGAFSYFDAMHQLNNALRMFGM